MDRSEDYTLNFEAVKTSFRQTKDGYHLTMVIHPSDVPKELFSSWVGTRYQCSIVQLNDENEPVKLEASVEADAIVQQAGMLCSSNRFQNWIKEFSGVDPTGPDEWGDNEEEYAARLLRRVCKIDSRSELRTDTEAQLIFSALYHAFSATIENGKDKLPW